MTRQQINAARKTRSLKSRLHAQSQDLTEHRQHIGKIGGQSLEDSWAVKGWVASGTWQGIIPWPSLENFQSTEAAITAALGTDDWGFQDSTATTFATLRARAVATT